jgi:cytochrome c556
MLEIKDIAEGNMRLLIAGLVSGTLVFGTGAAFAALDADSAIKYRRGVLSTYPGHLGGVFAGLKSPELAADMLAHAEALAASAKLPWKAFGPGTESGSEKTAAKASVWSDPAGFKAEAAKFEIAAAELLAAVKAQNKAAISAKAQATGVMCKSCHDKFKQ